MGNKIDGVQRIVNPVCAAVCTLGRWTVGRLAFGCVAIPVALAVLKETAGFCVEKGVAALTGARGEVRERDITATLKGCNVSLAWDVLKRCLFCVAFAPSTKISISSPFKELKGMVNPAQLAKEFIESTGLQQPTYQDSQKVIYESTYQDPRTTIAARYKGRVSTAWKQLPVVEVIDFRAFAGCSRD